jgi:hypothetical protein
MTTQSNVSSPIEVAPVRPLSWPLALAILALGVILGVFAANLAAAINQSDATAVPKRVIRDFAARPNLLELEREAHIATQANIQRGREAEAARYTSLGLFYAAASEAEGQQATTAEAARYNGLAEFYGANVTPSANIQRGREAEAARYTSLGLFYAADTEAEGQPATAAEAARYNGLAEFYGANVTPSPLDNALFVYHQSERGRISADSHTLAWPPRPAQFKPTENVVTRLDEMDLTTYHQSEREHTSSAILPTGGHEVATDGDIGLMEFSPVTHDTTLAWPPRPTQFIPVQKTVVLLTEAGLAQYRQSEWGPMSQVSEANPDRDIGLMEFSTK